MSRWRQNPSRSGRVRRRPVANDCRPLALCRRIRRRNTRLTASRHRLHALYTHVTAPLTFLPFTETLGEIVVRPKRFRSSPMAKVAPPADWETIFYRHRFERAVNVYSYRLYGPFRHLSNVRFEQPPVTFTNVYLSLFTPSSFRHHMGPSAGRVCLRLRPRCCCRRRRTDRGRSNARGTTV